MHFILKQGYMKLWLQQFLLSLEHIIETNSSSAVQFYGEIQLTHELLKGRDGRDGATGRWTTRTPWSTWTRWTG